MGADEFYKLFKHIVEAQRLDPKKAKELLKQIMDILFSDSEIENKKER